MSRRDQRNVTARRNYAHCTEIAGGLDFSADPQVTFRRVASTRQRVVLTLLALINSVTALVFIGWLLLPSHVPGPGVIGFGAWRMGIARVSFCVVICVETIRLVQNFAVWLFALAMKDPVPKAPMRGLRVAMLTTIVPAKEPISVVERTLRAMREVRYRGQVDIWILDEGNDPAVKAMAERLGVYHFSRKGIPHYNQPKGPFRAKTKAGNHNAWRDNYERYYDVVAQMDPDHVPQPCFLERTIGYFRDPDVAFVVAPQVYGNMYSSWLAHGASVQQYLFSGVVERGGNGLDAPLLIGTNHLYRPAAWQEIGGYQDSIIEDHLTSMRVQGTINPFTGNPWRGVYTPDVLAVGEGPESWTDYFNQQKRWAYGIWEILLKRKLRAGIRLRARQRLLYGLVQFYYPSAGATVLLGTVATSVYLLLGVTAMQLNSALWGALWGASMTSWMMLWLWLRRFNLAAHERQEIGLPGILLALFAGPVYVAAAATALLRRPLTYAVTAKGSLRSTDSVRTFRLHLIWAAAALALMGVSFHFHHDYTALRIWGGLAVVTGLGPLLILMASRLRAGRRDRPEPEPVPAPRSAGRQRYDLVGASRRGEASGRWHETGGSWAVPSGPRGAREEPEGWERDAGRRPVEVRHGRADARNGQTGGRNGQGGARNGAARVRRDGSSGPHRGNPGGRRYDQLAGPRPGELVVSRPDEPGPGAANGRRPPSNGRRPPSNGTGAPNGRPAAPNGTASAVNGRAAGPNGAPAANGRPFPAAPVLPQRAQLPPTGHLPHPAEPGAHHAGKVPPPASQGDPALRDLARDFSTGDPDLRDLVAPDLAAVGSAPAGARPAAERPFPALTVSDTMPDWRPGRLDYGRLDAGDPQSGRFAPDRFAADRFGSGRVDPGHPESHRFGPGRWDSGRGDSRARFYGEPDQPNQPNHPKHPDEPPETS